MEYKYIIKKVEMDFGHGVSIKNYGDTFNPMWGHDEIMLTKDDIMALLQGKVLETSCCGEYTILIGMEDEN